MHAYLILGGRASNIGAKRQRNTLLLCFRALNTRCKTSLAGRSNTPLRADALASCLLQATRKLLSKRVRRHEASGSELDDSDTDSKEKREKMKKRREKETKTKEAPRVWNEDTEKLRALVVTVAQGLPKHVGFKLPTTCYRGKPSDSELQERIAAFLTSKGLKSLQPNDEEMAAFRTKVFATPSSAMSNVGVFPACALRPWSRRPRNASI